MQREETGDDEQMSIEIKTKGIEIFGLVFTTRKQLKKAKFELLGTAITDKEIFSGYVRREDIWLTEKDASKHSKYGSYKVFWFD